MTNQEKKAFLGRYRDNERELSRLREEILRWESLAEKTTATLGGTGGGNGEDKVQTAVERIDALKDRLCKEVAERVRLRERIEEVIGTVPDERLQSLLRCRYIEGMTFERIAVELNYSWRQIIRMHGQALDNVIMS